MNKRKLGNLYEEKASSYLENKGYEILERNFSYKGGEIDIIAVYKRKLIAVEVKFRSSFNYGYAIESIDEYKLFRIYKGLQKFLDTSSIIYDDIGIEIITFDSDLVEHIEVI